MTTAYFSKRALFCALFCTAGSQAYAQGYPSRPVRVIAEFGAGSGGDLLLRAVQPALAESLGQPLIIENRPGAGGIVAAEQVARSAPDGYVIGAFTPNALISRRFLAKGGAGIDVLKDLTPLTAIGETVTLVLANQSSPVKTMKELIDYGKAYPGKLSYGTSGFGTVHHLSQEQIGMITGANLVHVPYKTGADAVTGLVSEQIPISYAILGSIGPHLRSGKVFALARVGTRRYEGLPNVPALSEFAPGFEGPPSWTGLFGPANLPSAVLRRVGNDSVKVLHQPAIKARMAEAGFEVIGNTPEEYAGLIRRQIDLVERIVKAANIKPID